MAIVICGESALAVFDRIRPPGPEEEVHPGYDNEMIQLVQRLEKQSNILEDNSSYVV
jgi:hypothetical protein